MTDDIETEPWKETDRKRGILTEADREYLLGKRSVEGQDEINTRYRIRQRIIQSLLDIKIIVDNLSGEDLKQVANDARIDNRYIRVAATEMAYNLAYWNENFADSISVFEGMIGDAVPGRGEVLEEMSPAEIPEGAIGRLVRHVDIEFEQEIIDIDNTDPESLAKKHIEIEKNTSTHKGSIRLQELADGVLVPDSSETDDS